MTIALIFLGVMATLLAIFTIMIIVMGIKDREPDAIPIAFFGIIFTILPTLAICAEYKPCTYTVVSAQTYTIDLNGAEFEDTIYLVYDGKDYTCVRITDPTFTFEVGGTYKMQPREFEIVTSPYTHVKAKDFNRKST